MGVAVAQEAIRRGHETHLLLGEGATAHPDLPPDACTRFDTTSSLQTQLERLFPSCDLLIMAAAVADFIPPQATAGTKMSRRDGPVTITLQPAADLVAALASSKQSHQRIVGFALEPAETLRARAEAKLQAKGLDAIVANPLDTIEAAAVTAAILSRDGTWTAAPPQLPKSDFAAWLLDRLGVENTA